MKLIKIVKLARVRYGDLDEGCLFKNRRGHKYKVGSKLADSLFRKNTQVMPLDHPPESVTYTIEGIPEGLLGHEEFVDYGDYAIAHLSHQFDEIETRYI